MPRWPARIATRAIPRTGPGSVILTPQTVGGTTNNRNGPVAATGNVTWAAPGIEQWPDWDGRAAIDSGYYGSVYVMRSLQTIGDTLASLAFRAGLDPTNPAEYDTGAPLAHLLGPATPQAPGGPNPTTSSRAFWAWSVIAKLATGKMAWEIQTEGPGGPILNLWPLVSHLVTPIPSVNLTSRSGPQRWFDSYRYQLPTGPITLDADHVFYAWKSSQRDWRQPESLIEAAQLPISISIAFERHMWSLLKNGMVAAHMVTSLPIEESDQRRAWEDKFTAEFTGFDNAGKPIFDYVEPDLNGKLSDVGTSVQPLATKPVDAELMKLAEWAKTETLVATGVPESLIGNASQRIFANADAEERNFWTTRMLGVITEVEDDVNTNLAPRVGREVGWFDLSHVVALQPPKSFTPPAFADLLAAGVIKPEDVSRMLDLGVEGIDTTTAPLGEEAIGGGLSAGSRSTPMPAQVRLAGGGLLERRMVTARTIRELGVAAWDYDWHRPNVGSVVTVEARNQPAATPELASKVRAQAVEVRRGRDLSDTVYAALVETYPPSVLRWVRKATWRLDRAVPLAEIKMGRRRGGRDQKKVAGITEALTAGKTMDPIVVVETGADRYVIADGYHRTLAAQRAGKTTIAAYVASGVGEHGPWDEAMHDAKLNRMLELEARYDTSPLGEGHNWVTDVGGLPLYARAIAHALIRDGHDESEAVQIAIGTLRRWASGGDKVTAKTRAKATAALAEWEAKKAASHTGAGRRKAASHTGSGRRNLPLTSDDTAGALRPVGQPVTPAGGRGPRRGPTRRALRIMEATLGHRIEVRHAGPSHAPVPTGHTNTPARARQATKKAHVAHLDQVEPAIADGMRTLFARQAEGALARLHGKRGRQMVRKAGTRADPPSDQQSSPPDVQPAQPVNVDPAAIFDPAYWALQTAATLGAVYLPVISGPVAQTRAQLGGPVIPAQADSMSNQAVADALHTRADTVAAQITQTTYQALADTLNEGMAAGESTDQLAARVRQTFDEAGRTRSELIARTEANSAANIAQNTYADSLPPGIVAGREWVAIHDERTRSDHRLADGQRQPMGVPFLVGGWPMMHPGDPTAPPEQTCNCRCTTAFLPASQAHLIPGRTIRAA